MINSELNPLHQELLSFATNKYENKIKEQTESYYKSLLHEKQNNEETMDVYNTGLFIWLIFHLPFLKNNQTVFDVFYKKKESELNRQIRKNFSKWADTVPSVYEIISINRALRHLVLKSQFTSTS